MAIRRSYSPPFQARAPQLGVDDFGRAVKSLVNVEVSRSNEITFAVESFGCDGKPVLSTLRGLDCETDGKLVMAGTKGGMPFKLGSDLPRGVGSAIRGTGGGLVQVTGGVAMLTREWVLYDNYGNHWSLDQGSTPVYLGETPPLANGDGITPATCEMDPHVRTHEIWGQYYDDGGTGEGSGGTPSFVVWGYGWRYGWTEDGTTTPVYPDPAVIWEFPDPTAWRVTQWIPDETTPPDGTGLCGVWPASNRRALVYWTPTGEDPHDFDALGGGIGTIVSAYPTVPDYPPTVPGPPYYAPTSGFYYWLNEATRPSVEQLSVGGTLGEAGLLVRIETNGTTRRYSMHDRFAGTRLSYTGTGPSSFTRSDGRHFWTPYKTEGWIAQNGVVTSSQVTLARYWSRAADTDEYGSALTYKGTTTVTLPSGAVHAWDAEPVWFRVGRVSRSFGNTRITPLLPRW
jgi:hypothetical protein